MTALPEVDSGEYWAYVDGYTVGFQTGTEIEHDRWTYWLGIARKRLDTTAYVEIERRREVDHQPCAGKCRRCSRCIHSMAWYARGRRDFRGTEVDPVVWPIDALAVAS